MSSCTLGDRREARIGLVCWQHHDRLADLLDPRNHGTRFNHERPDDPQVVPSIPVLYGRLSALRGGNGLSPVGPPAFGPSSPGDDQVLVLRDPRSRAEVAGPDDVDRAPRPPLVVLSALAIRTAAARGAPERPWALTVHGLASFLHGALPWLVQQPWIGDVWHELRGLSATLQAALGDPPPAAVGTCRAIVDDDGHETPAGPWRCAVPLYMPELPPRAPDEPIQLPSLRCGSCGHRYSGAELVQLGQAQQLVAS